MDKAQHHYYTFDRSKISDLRYPILPPDLSAIFYNPDDIPPVTKQIFGLENLTAEEIERELQNGGRFVIYQYCISFIFVSFMKSSSIYFYRKNQTRIRKKLKYTLISFFFGWWGFPWGILYTFEAIYRNLLGGWDLTDLIATSAAASLNEKEQYQIIHEALKARNRERQQLKEENRAKEENQ